MYILTSHNDGAGSTLNAYDFPTFNAASEAMKEEIRELYEEMHREYREEDGEIYDDGAALELFGVMYEWKVIHLPSNTELLGVSEGALTAAKEYAETADPEDRLNFEFQGVFIVNPWMDPTARFPLTTEQAIATYGLENIRKYVNSPIFQIKVSKVRLLEMLQRYVDFDLQAAETGYVRDVLTDVCGMTNEEAEELGFDYLFDKEAA